MGVAESSVRYRSCRSDEALRVRLLEAAREKPRWGYRRLQIVLDQAGEHVNHKRIYRVYREAGLMIRRRPRKRLLRAESPRPALTAANQEWALDFVHDAAESGRKFRALSVVDPYTRECLALEVDTSMGSRRVTRVLEQIIAERGLPQAIRSDNGPEFTSRHFLAWCGERKIQVVHIEPGKPVQNAHVESFHGKLRDECLNASWFQNLWDARNKIEAWRKEYNEEHRTAVWDTRRRRRSPPEWERYGRLRLPASPHSAHLRNQQLACSKAQVSYDLVRGLWGQVTPTRHIFGISS